MKSIVNCENCYKYYNPVISKECSLCNSFNFLENTFCDLLRSIKEQKENIECCSFKPNLSISGQNLEKFKNEKTINNIEISERSKYLKTYALQQWKFDPKQIFSDLNFHVCLISKNREKIFYDFRNNVHEISEIFEKTGILFKGRVNFLSLGYDHLHIHINQSPDYSPDEVLTKIINSAETSILNKYFKNKTVLFENTYFIESIG
jgi:REP element-mobilizing transposase RayT